jgi:hypothetical protein
MPCLRLCVSSMSPTQPETNHVACSLPHARQTRPLPTHQAQKVPTVEVCTLHPVPTTHCQSRTKSPCPCAKPKLSKPSRSSPVNAQREAGGINNSVDNVLKPSRRRQSGQRTAKGRRDDHVLLTKEEGKGMGREAQTDDNTQHTPTPTITANKPHNPTKSKSLSKKALQGHETGSHGSRSLEFPQGEGEESARAGLQPLMMPNTNRTTSVCSNT